MVQERMRGQVVPHDDFGPVRRIAAVDAHFSESDNKTWAAVAEIDPVTLELTRSVLLWRPTVFPYVPGFLSFREVPAMVAALSLLPEPPDLLVVDGQGLAHPRRFGLACHLGVVTGLPAIGVAKSRLVGRYDEPGRERGSSSPMFHRRELVGVALRTRDGTNPLFVSVGHRVSLPTAVDLVLRFSPKWRLPEPIRLADAISRMHG
ncbi:endonuclease V [Skermanella stibiiresistens SB22]|uniref:Endonuclease V n=1 Tax=Skermanella stibiiresistens SB22 TaxID=1385369 RepID=W9GXD4_9PROT|nr:deoxyribonuclease V [Skermanella stibiiresistens]EWY38479.1 endonuclease V [Skermanella stibiiresistens SB22]